MSTEYFMKENNIVSIGSVFEKMQNFKISISDEVKKRIENPIEAYIEQTLPLKIKDETKRKKKEEILRRKYNKDLHFKNEEIKDKIHEILEKYDLKKDFSFFEPKEIRCLLRYDILWTTNDFNQYMIPLIKYIQSDEKFYKLFKHILQLYIRKYSKLKNNNEFKNFFKNMFEKYRTNKKHIPKYIDNLLVDCNLLAKNAVDKLSYRCLQEKEKSHINILEILSERYRYIRPHTDLFNEAIIKICEICKNKLKEDFYFNLLFNEILCSDIEPELSAKIVSEVVRLFDEDIRNKENLEKIKNAILKNHNYGDPRITKAEKNWFLVDTESKHIFITWLAQSDLEFFFKIAFRGIEDRHGRKAFWQKYIKSHQLEESHVIWGQVHYNMPEIKEEQERSNVEFKYFVHEDDCSCFILKFNDIYVVEYSIRDNAVFIYNSNKFIDITGSHFWDRNVFKQQDVITFSQKDIDKGYNLNIKEYENGIFKISHHSKWENVVEKILQSNGIYKE